jgi:glycosyltransferase involved in cell wall biosynthesis
MKRSKKRILWVTFDFPPRQSSAVFRPIKIYKYLDKDKFEVDFLTQSVMSKSKRAVQDKTILQDVFPQPKIYRLPNIVFDDFIRAIINNFRKKNRPDNSEKINTKIGTPKDYKPTAAKKIYRLFIMLFYFPDQFFIWGWMAAFKALWLHLKRRYDVIYTTSYPESGHLPGLILRHFGVKWVVDYRYAGVFWNKDKLLRYPKKKVRGTIEFYYQKYVLRKADYVITQSETIKNDFCRIFSLNSSNVIVIPSGYDEDDFIKYNVQGTPFIRNKNEIHILHSGVWSLNENEVTKVIKELNRLHLNIKEKGYEIVLHALGNDLFNKEQRENGIRFKYLYHGVIPHQDLIPYLLATDCYLVSTIATIRGTNPVRGYLPSKLWDYMRGGKPILLFGLKDDDAWQIIDEAGAGLYMGLLNDEECISADELLGFVKEMKSLNLKVGQHSWESRAHSFQDVFLRVLEEKAGA